MKKVLQFSFLILTIQFISCGNSQNQNENSNEPEIIQKIIFNPQINEDTKVNGDVESFTWIERKGKIENEKVVEDFTYRSYVVKYDKEGNIIEHSSYGRDKDYPFRTAKYKYENGYLAEWIESSFDENGKKENEYSYEKYVYEESKVKAYRYSEEGEVIFYYEIQFDDKGKKLSAFRDNKFTEHKDEEYWKYYYDENNFLIRATETLKAELNLELNYEEKYKNDKYGNVIDKSRVNLDDINKKSGDKYEYKYDNNGNWVRRVSYDKDDGMIFIHEREINYR